MLWNQSEHFDQMVWDRMGRGRERGREGGREGGREDGETRRRIAEHLPPTALTHATSHNTPFICTWAHPLLRPCVLLLTLSAARIDRTLLLLHLSSARWILLAHLASAWIPSSQLPFRRETVVCIAFSLPLSHTCNKQDKKSATEGADWSV